MSPVRLLPHDHEICRVVRAGWGDPLDPSFSRQRDDRRWNTRDFPALYSCCSPWVARAVTLDLFAFAGVEVEELQPAWRPELCEIAWSGETVDVCTSDGVAAAGFPETYPGGVSRSETQSAAGSWRAKGLDGVVCRSASLHRMGLSRWNGAHRGWGEVAIFSENTAIPPQLIRRRNDLAWFRVAPAEPG